MAAAIVPVGVPADWQRLHPSDYKDLTQTLRVGGARIVAERSSPLGLVTVVENAAIPLRHAPGLSLNAAMELPQQLGIFVDGDGPSALTHYDGRREPLAYLDYLTSALPYHLLVQPRVLVLGAGAGADVLQALYHRAPAIDAVELDPQVIDLVQRALSDFSGKPYGDPAVRVRIGEARGFVARSSGRYDLIQVALLDAFGVASAGLHALSESYLYTVEALQEYLEHLEPGGMLAITRWVNLPPRDVLKLFATAVEALERRGASEPAKQLILIRGWKTATLVVKNGAFTSADLGALKEFCRQRSFDVAYYPGIEPAETNRYNLLEEPFFHDGALAVLGPDRDAFFDRYKFAITPATDDRPYYFHFFKWRTLPELLQLKEQGGLPLLEWGYPVLVATLMQALAASLLLILLPLWILRRRSNFAGPADVSSLRVGTYFLAIGFAFMFVEIAFIQKFVLFLSHPLYAIASVLCAFLIFAGAGSRFSRRLLSGKFAGRASPVVWPAIAIGLLALTYAFVLPSVFKPLMALPDELRIVLTLVLIAPLAFAMGMPFPLGLASLAARAPPLIPWAWAINACASVIAAIVATLLAIHFGFTAVVLAAILLYALSVAIYR
jgi:spermidine synthase